MPDFFQQLRRSATQLAIGQSISATAAIPIRFQRSVVRLLITRAHSISALRRRVLENMRLALGEAVPAQAARLYFHHLGWALSSALSTFHHGVMATPVPEEVKFDESVRLLDEAVAEGRGVVFATAHWSGHELVAAIVNHRHPMAMLVRQAPTPERMKRKLNWYKALGAEIILRPTGASTLKDAAAYLNVLRRGKMLGITPDLLARLWPRDRSIYFRTTGAPARRRLRSRNCREGADDTDVFTVGFRYVLVAVFDRATLTVDGHDRDTAIRAGVQDWCRWFEQKLAANPENWMFWLDKRWSRFLRTTTRAASAE